MEGTSAAECGEQQCQEARCLYTPQSFEDLICRDTMNDRQAIKCSVKGRTHSVSINALCVQLDGLSLVADYLDIISRVVGRRQTPLFL